MQRLADSADAAEALAMARDSAAASAAASASALAPTGRADVIAVVVPGGKGVELSLEVPDGGRVRYSWKTDGGVVDFVVLGDSTGFERGKPHLYSRGFSQASRVGAIVAAFDGLHGWYWRNTTDSSVTIILHTSGAYTGVRGPRQS